MPVAWPRKKPAKLPKKGFTMQQVFLRHIGSVDGSAMRACLEYAVRADPQMLCAGRNPKFGFEGGQTPLKKRAPKRGFHNP